MPNLIRITIDITQNLLPLVPSHFGFESWRLVQDGVSPHKALRVRQWLNDNVPQVLKLPSKSPDLTAIEEVWSWMKSYVGLQNLQL